MRRDEVLRLIYLALKQEKSDDQSALTFKQGHLICLFSILPVLSPFSLERGAKKRRRETRKGNDEVQFMKCEALHVMGTFTVVLLERCFKWRPPTAAICRIVPNCKVFDMQVCSLKDRDFGVSRD